MSNVPLHFLMLTLAGWMTRNQQLVIEYLLAENVVLRQLRGRRIRYTDPQRRRLAIAATKLGRKALSKLDTLVTPQTLLRWDQQLIAKKYDGGARRETRDYVERRTSSNSCCGWRARKAAGATRASVAR